MHRLAAACYHGLHGARQRVRALRIKGRGFGVIKDQLAARRKAGRGAQGGQRIRQFQVKRDAQPGEKDRLSAVQAGLEQRRVQIVFAEIERDPVQVSWHWPSHPRQALAFHDLSGRVIDFKDLHRLPLRRLAEGVGIESGPKQDVLAAGGLRQSRFGIL